MRFWPASYGTLTGIRVRLGGPDLGSAAIWAYLDGVVEDRSRARELGQEQDLQVLDAAKRTLPSANATLDSRMAIENFQSRASAYPAG